MDDPKNQEPGMRLIFSNRVTRRRLLQVAGGGLAAAAGVAALYEALALISPAPRRYGPPAHGYPPGQYQIASYGVRTVSDPESAVQVDVPPVWNLVVTATLTRAPGPRDQERLEAALQAVEAVYPYSPAGVFLLVAYGLPYFRNYIQPDVYAAHLPHMVDADQAPVLLDAVRFASDPTSLALEANDVVFHLRSDTLDQLHDVQQALFGRSGRLAGQRAHEADISDLFTVTSVRTGFVGAGLPRRMAQQAGLVVASKIPEAAPLFMGFTSTQQLGQAREEAVSFEGRRDPLLLPLTSAKPGDYFAGGTTMHLSHLREDLDTWYALSYEERLARMFHPGAAAAPGRVTVATSWLNPNPAEFHAQRESVMGHNEAIQLGSRSEEGQALQLRADFNTMDPLDGSAAGPGVHFLAFTAGSQIFHRGRQAMDATAVEQRYGLAPTANGINAFIRATRRQNFLAPPRMHRAFPLLELAHVL
jgi:hypothetical protein